NLRQFYKKDDFIRMLLYGKQTDLYGFNGIVLIHIIIDHSIKSLRVKKILILLANHFLIAFYRKLRVFSKIKIIFHHISFSRSSKIRLNSPLTKLTRHSYALYVATKIRYFIPKT